MCVTVIWANNTTTKVGFTQLQAPFKFSTPRKQLALENSIVGTLDSISFGAQSSNVLERTCLNEISSFQFFITPTPAAANCASTGINEIFYSNFSVYPNPVKNRFTVAVEGNATVKVFSVQGAIMLAENISQTQEFSRVNFPNGIYFIEVSKGKLISAKKLIVE